VNLSDLPPHLRGVLVCALLLTIAISAGAFALSYVALDSIASQAGLHWSGISWVFPFCIDALLIVSELALVAASCVTIAETGRPANRLLPFLFMVAFGATSIWLNTTRVPTELRFVAAIPPLASICGTVMIAFLVKLLARSLGRQMTFHAPPPAAALGYPQTTVVQLPDGSYGLPGSPVAGYPPQIPAAMPAYGHLGSPTTSTNGHSGGELNDASAQVGDATTKRALVDMYLSGLSPEQLQLATGSSIVQALGSAGVTVSGREANRELDAFRSAQQQAKRKR
jgi:hypothetical protein